MRLVWMIGALVLMVAGISPDIALAGPATAGELQGSWRLVEIGFQPVRATAAEARPVLTITGQSIAGFDGCNNFQGQLDRPGSVASTRRGCLEGTVKLPLDLADPMSHLQTGRIEGKRLTLPARPDFPESAFERVD